jgi:hypothetical protein
VYYRRLARPRWAALRVRASRRDASDPRVPGVFGILLRATRAMRRRRAGVGTVAAETSLGSSSSFSTTTAAPSDWLSVQLERASACGSVGRAAAFAGALGAATGGAGLGGGLLYDDRALVIKNEDLRPSTPWTALLFHDFWGTSLDDPRSHTSWRPVTVATLKLNFHTHQLEPSGYHAVNLALHASVCAMVVLAAKRCGIGGQQWQPSALCGVLFAVHPVHGALPAQLSARKEHQVCIKASGVH